MKIIHLKNDALELEVLPELGGGIKSFNFFTNGIKRPIFRHTVDPKNVGELGYFPLIPFSNRIKNGHFQWRDKSINLPLNFLPEKHAIHGFGWQSEWQITEQSNTQLVLSYKNNCAQWPFDFAAKQIFTLTDNTLEIELHIENHSNEPMPCGLGFHPYFTKTEQVKVETGANQMWAVDNECLPTDIVTSPIAGGNKKYFNIADHQLDNALLWPTPKATIDWPEWALEAELTSSKNCPFLVCYSPSKEDFFCLEPVTHCTDAFNKHHAGESNTGTYELAPHEKFEVKMAVEIIQQ